MKTPILIYPFKRPDLTQKVLDNLMKSKPSSIFIAMDGPREDIIGEKQQVEKVRALIDNYNFGDCKIEKLYLKKNIGIHRLHEFISWFFDKNETGIVLEDDIVPNLSFFKIVDKLLEYYKNNYKIKFITGSNFISHKYKTKKTYFFTQIPSFWGFATWSDRWKEIDYDLVRKISEKEYIEILKRVFKRKKDFLYFKRLFDYQRNNQHIGGDQKVMFNIWAQNGLSIVPSINLISNIGINHKYANSKTSEKMSKLSKLKTIEIKEIIHPDKIAAEEKYDKMLMDKIFNPNQTILNKIYRKLSFNI